MTHPYPSESEAAEAVSRLLTALADEDPKASHLLARLPLDTPTAQRRALRAVLATRAPGPLPADSRTALDGLLASEARARGYVEADGMPGTELDPQISLFRGDITTLRADAIVNAANSALLGCFIPLHSCIDNAIHSAAGPGLREECAAIMASRGRPEPTGTATVTDGYHLPATHVIHTVGPIVTGTPTAHHADQLASCYRSVLNAAASLGLSTIGFCCISTGVFGYPQAAAAEVAVQTVRSVLPHYPTLTKVVFDVFTPIDESLYRDLLGANR